MTYRWLATTTVCVLAYASGAIADEPKMERSTATTTSGSVESWGDPEDNEERPKTWTWFGMGYERRTQAGPASGMPGSRSSRGTGQQQQTGRK